MAEVVLEVGPPREKRLIEGVYWSKPVLTKIPAGEVVGGLFFGGIEPFMPEGGFTVTLAEVSDSSYSDYRVIAEETVYYNPGGDQWIELTGTHSDESKWVTLGFKFQDIPQTAGVAVHSMSLTQGTFIGSRNARNLTPAWA